MRFIGKDIKLDYWCYDNKKNVLKSIIVILQNTNFLVYMAINVD